MARLLVVLFTLVLSACTAGTTTPDTCVPEGNGCIRSCDPGNSLRVGKYCTKGSGECEEGWKSGFAFTCTADNTSGEAIEEGLSFCTMGCSTNADCAEGAICTGSSPDSPLKGCFPARCDPSNPGTPDLPDAGSSTPDAGSDADAGT